MVGQPPPLYKDTYLAYNTKNIIYGNFISPPNDYIKRIIVAVIKSYTIDSDNSSDDAWGKYLDELYAENPNYTYDDLIKVLGKTHDGISTESVLAHVMAGYRHVDSELITRCLNTFCRPLKLSGKYEWLDNWTLNAPGNALNFMFWSKFNSPDIAVVPRDFAGIGVNEGATDVKIDSNSNFIPNNATCINNIADQRVRKTKLLITQNDIKKAFAGNQFVLKVVGIFRAFLICNNLLPDMPENNAKMEFTSEDITNTSVKYFPFYYVGCGGCDMFDSNFTADIQTIKCFLVKYPQVSVGSIINVSTFKSGDGGSHWMGLYFTYKNASLLCPQASRWDILGDDGVLYNSLINLGFAVEHNGICCQKDNCNCGIYSFLFLFTMLLLNGDMKKAVDRVGVNAAELKTKTTQLSPGELMIFKIKNTLFGYE